MLGRVNLEVGSSGVEATGTNVFQSDQQFSTRNRQEKASQRRTAPHHLPGMKPHHRSASTEVCPHPRRRGCRDLL